MPILSGFVKKHYDDKQAKRFQERIRDFLNKDELPYVKEAPLQYSVGHEPTIRCNLRCKMCYQADTRALRRSELDTEQIFKIYAKLKDKIKSIKLVGGEPMVRSDIFALIDYLDKQDIKVTLQSNCTLINKNNIEKFKKYQNITDVVASLDGSQETHDEIRGVPGTFDRLKNALGLLQKNRTDIPITIFGMLLINDNIDKMFELVDTCKSFGINSINILFEQVYSQGSVENTKKIFKQEFGWEPDSYQINTQIREPDFPSDLNSNELRKKLDKVRDYGIKKKCYVNFTPFNYYNNLDGYLKKKPIKVFCTKLLSPQLRINQKGNVIWCDTIEKSFGSLLEKTPDEIWLSEDYQKFRKFLFKHSLPVCTRCCKGVYIENGK